MEYEHLTDKEKKVVFDFLKFVKTHKGIELCLNTSHIDMQDKKVIIDYINE